MRRRPTQAPSAVKMSECENNRWFSQEVQPHESALRCWLGPRFPSLTDRDDLVQESFLRVIQARAAGPIANVRAFLFATARNLALNHLRHRGYRHPEGLGEIDPSSVIDERADTSEAVARQQELELLHESIQSLPERCRQVFTLQRCVEFFREHDALAAPQPRPTPARPAPASVLPFPNPEVHHA